MESSPTQAGLVDQNHKYGFMVCVKTTLEIPDYFYRKLKVAAAQQGKSVRQFVNEAIAEKMWKGPKAAQTDPPWMKAFGGLSDLREETRRIQRFIDEQCGKIEPEDWK
jgi:hypothetical protein